MNRYISVIDEKTQLKKPTVMIHITNDLSITARKIIGIFLKNAYNDIMQDTWHSIKVSDLIAFLGEKSYKPSHLKKVLNELQTTLVQWNIMGKDQKPIEFMNGGTSFSLVAGIKYQSASVEAGFIQYYFAKPLVEELFIPTRIYAKINLWIQQRFTNKHAMAIWEYLIEVICTTTRNEKTIVTSWIEIKHLRLLLGLKDDEYKTFADVNKHIIKKAVLEINKVSEIEVDFDLRRNSRKVDAVRFFITKKDDWNKYHSRDTGDLSVLKNSYNVEQKTLINAENDPQKQLLIGIMRDEFGIGEAVARTNIDTYGSDCVSKSIDYSRKYIAKMQNKIASPSGFLLHAIKNSIEVIKTTEEIEKHKMLQEKEERERVESKILEDYKGFDGVECIFRDEVISWLKYDFRDSYFPILQSIKIVHLSKEMLCICVPTKIYVEILSRDQFAIEKLQRKFFGTCEYTFGFAPQKFEVKLWKEY